MDEPRHERKCKAKSSRTGKPCSRWAIRGGVVCPTHGGRAPQVKRKAEERIRDFLEQAIDPDRSLRESARLAFSNVQDLFDDHGNLKPVKEWPEDVARAVSGLEVVKKNLTTGDGKVDEVLKVRLWDKNAAAERLFKHLGLLKERLEHAGEIKIRWKDE